MIKNKLQERKLWITKDGRILHLSIMSYEHINACINMLRDQGKIGLKESLKYIISGYEYDMMGDGAQMAFDREQDIAFSKIPSIWIDLFEEELTRRLNYEKEIL